MFTVLALSCFLASPKGLKETYLFAPMGTEWYGTWTELTGYRGILAALGERRQVPHRSFGMVSREPEWR